jgi:arginyl-tRNA synthetase
MLFDPKESIDFNGNTASFIQYTHARIKSILRRSGDTDFDGMTAATPDAKELELIKLLDAFPETVKAAGENLSPAIVANYIYELSKEYNQFYHDYPVLKETDAATRTMRLALSRQVAETVRKGMLLLGIDVPDKM